MIEAYKIGSTFTGNVGPMLAAIAEMLAPLQNVLKVQREIAATQAAITSNTRASATAAAAFANNMERAARAARDVAAGTATAEAATARSAATTAAAAATTRAAAAVAIAAPDYSRGHPNSAPNRMIYGPPPAYLGDVYGPPLPPPQLLLANPQHGVVAVGAPYGTGTNLVPLGSPLTRSEAFSPRPADGSALALSGGGIGGPPTAPPNPLVGPAPNGPTPNIAIPLGNPNSPGPGPFPVGSAYFAGAAAQQAGNTAGGLISSAFTAAANVDAIKGALKAQGLSPEEVDAAYKKAVATQQNVLGTFVGQNLQIVGTLMALTQSATDSINLMPEAAKAGAVFRGLGRGDGQSELTASLTAAELRGVLFKTKDGKEQADPEAIAHFLANMTAISAVSSGRYGPTEMLQLLRSGGVAAAMMTDENSFAEMLPLIQSMGSQRAGTGLRAFSQQFSAGKMSEAAVKLLTEMNIIKNPELKRKLGMGTFQLMPGAMAPDDVEKVRQHPEAFIMENLVPAVRGWLTKQYGTRYTGADDKGRLGYEQAALQQIASRIPGGDEMANVLRNEPLIERDTKALRRAQGRDAFGDVVTQNPVMRLAGFDASINALMITLGQDNMAVAIATLKSLTAAFNAMNNVFIANPLLGSQVMLLADGLMVLGKVIGTVLMAILPLMAVAKVATWGGAAAASIGGGTAGAAMVTAGATAGALVSRVFIPVMVAGVLREALNYIDPKNKVDAWADKHVPGYAWFDYHANKMINGTGDDAADRKAFDKARGLDQTTVHVGVYLDSNEISSHIVKKVVNGATGPLTGSGDYDSHRGMTPTEN